MTLRHEHPRPLLRRHGWISLDGPWEFAIDREGRWGEPGEVRFDRTIEVPFAPETKASGVGDTGFYLACWYRLVFDAPALAVGQRLLLHFAAVDYHATVWVNRTLAGTHEGGYTPFDFDVTEAVRDPGPHEIVVCARDDPSDLAKPRGKQDWMLEPHSIWYPRTTGIWQTVWLEVVPATWIGAICWTPNLERWEVGLEVRVDGEKRSDLALHVRLSVGDLVLADDRYAQCGSELARRIALSDPGIDDYRNELLWSPSSPTLIEAELELRDERGAQVDAVTSYTALRKIAVQGERIVLNGRPLVLRMVLDQGYWPETGMTAPSDDALRADVELAKAMGFNGVRKHQKIEAPRYLYWADRLGLLVWEEMPSAYRFTVASVERLTRQWVEAMRRDASHPCIVAWVPFNESWGVPNLPDIPAERHFVQALYHLTKTLDPTRPVVGNDGWESVATDIIGIHDYEEDPELLERRYETDEEIPHLFRRERPGGRLLTLEGHPHAGQPLMLTEFGGIAFSQQRGENWGYSRAETAEEFAALYQALLEAVRGISLFAGYCYTQFADTFQETNGLLYADRTPKFPLPMIELATRGPRKPREEEVEREWRVRMLKFQKDRHVAVAAGIVGDDEGSP
ncbi:MAG: glycoside hydrolase family 2 [Proteobacteria bacterium]|nr:MAG: glycoside hydrolase family 2 [Pseudomonadota bacterium]